MAMLLRWKIQPSAATKISHRYWSELTCVNCAYIPNHSPLWLYIQQYWLHCIRGHQQHQQELIAQPRP